MSKVNKVVRKINREILMAIVVIIFGAVMLSMVCCKYSKDSKFNRLWKQYYISPTGYLAPTTYSVVGIPPIKAVMEKGEKEDKQGYFIREFYSEGILLNNKVGEKNAHKYGSDVHASWGMLEYFIETNEDGDVTTIYFPNGISMGLEGFEKILAPNCPYNQKQ